MKQKLFNHLPIQNKLLKETHSTEIYKRLEKF